MDSRASVHGDGDVLVVRSRRWLLVSEQKMGGEDDVPSKKPRWGASKRVGHEGKVRRKGVR
ncbi:hypothetical protein CDL15_Pgr023467 [Punica granatum]|nr:hypothetical protein CDL15_Pgr023467 [Punica granatum]